MIVAIYKESVIATIAIKRIVTTKTSNGIIAFTATNSIGIVITSDCVITVTAIYYYIG